MLLWWALGPSWGYLPHVDRNPNIVLQTHIRVLSTCSGQNIRRQLLAGLKDITTVSNYNAKYGRFHASCAEVQHQEEENWQGQGKLLLGV